MNVKELFEKTQDGVLTYEQFSELAKQENAKFVDLSDGEYVSKHKYDADVHAKSKEIETLTGTIGTRDADLEALRKKLEDAGTDATKLSELTAQFTDLKGKYDADTKAYKDQLKKQAYEFAVKEFAGAQNFSSKAAKRDFIQSMIAKQLTMDGDSILGADDFVKSYTEQNEDAFITEYLEDDEPEAPLEKPQFVSSTQGASENSGQDPTGGFLNAFHFTPVR